MKTNRISLALLVLPLAGCIPLTQEAPVSSTGPANPNAEEGGYPSAMRELMTGDNYSMGPPAEGKPMEKDMNMNKHGAQPMKMPQPHGEEPTPDKSSEHDGHHHNAPNQ